jgi:hypothetical protein
MNEVAILNSIEPRRLLPVSEIKELMDNVYELYSISDKAHESLHRLKHNYYYSLEEVENALAELGALPSHTINTLTLLDDNMKTATSAQIADVLTVLHGLFVSQGDPQIMATVGVEIIEAEKASALALYRAGMTLLRPPPKSYSYDEYGDLQEDERPPARKFLPTIPEIIAELRDQQEFWAARHAWLKVLPKWHAQARRELIGRIDELRRAPEAESDAAPPEEEEDWPF